MLFISDIAHSMDHFENGIYRTNGWSTELHKNIPMCYGPTSDGAVLLSKLVDDMWQDSLIQSLVVLADLAVVSFPRFSPKLS